MNIAGNKYQLQCIKGGTVQIVKSVKKIEQENVYDISVDEFNHYILANGLISHNSGLRYAASGIVFLSKSKDRDGKEIVGNFIKVKMDKSRLSKENATVELKLSYESGLDKYFGLLELAEEAKIFVKSGLKYEIPHLPGKKYFTKEIYADPETFFTQEILDKLDQIVQRKFSYGNNGTHDGEQDSDSDIDL